MTTLCAADDHNSHNHNHNNHNHNEAEEEEEALWRWSRWHPPLALPPHSSRLIINIINNNNIMT